MKASLCVVLGFVHFLVGRQLCVHSPLPLPRKCYSMKDFFLKLQTQVSDDSKSDSSVRGEGCSIKRQVYLSIADLLHTLCSGKGIYTQVNAS